MTWSASGVISETTLLLLGKCTISVTDLSTYAVFMIASPHSPSPYCFSVSSFLVAADVKFRDYE